MTGPDAGGPLVIQGGLVVTDPGEGTVVEGTVVVAAGRVVHAGPGEPAGGVPAGAERIDASGCAVLPGLVSCHAHCRPFRGLGDGLGMMAWHDRYVHQFAAAMDGEDAYYGALNTFLEMLRNGITTAQVMTSVTVVLDEEVAAAVDAGIRARLVPHVARRDEVEATVARIEAEAAAGADRVRTWLGLEVPELAEDATLALVAVEGERLGVGVHTHFAEFEPGDLARLDRAGLLRPNLSLAHCVHLSDANIGRLAATGVAVSHNPRSNSRYGNGVAPLRRLLDAGVRVGLGTDGPDSTFSCDVFEEARLAAFLARATALDPRALGAPAALGLATAGGADALDLGDAGRLRPGAVADVIVVDLRGPWAAPVLAGGPHANLLPTLAFAAVGRDVRDVVVDGRVVMRDRAFAGVDAERVVAECGRRAAEILAGMEAAGPDGPSRPFIS